MKIVFYQTDMGRSPVEDFIHDLPKQDQARFADVFKGVREYGLNCPRVTFKPLRGKLWEVKFKAKGGGYRIAYVLIEKETMVWLHAFRKTTQKTPKSDLAIAEKRMQEVL
jgi:phage-related protein